MRVDDFDFELPEDLIALRPSDTREDARLLVVRPRLEKPPLLEDRRIGDLPAILEESDHLVFNDTKVLPAFLQGIRTRSGQDARIEVTLHKRVDDESWRAFARPAKRLNVDDCIVFDKELSAQVTERVEGGEVELRFSKSGPELLFALQRFGTMPLPPYIARKRAADKRDRHDYQTMFADREGAVAAPTAGFHFTPDLMARFSKRGISHSTVTLHVGAGTFLPVKVQDTRDHVMHYEWGEISDETAARITNARASGRIMAVGTTSLRLLESACDTSGQIQPFQGDTNLFITPGTSVRSADILMTNFHLPRSTLFMLVCAFCGTSAMKAAYAHAIERQYRFYSYGDACLLFPQESQAV